MPDPKKIVDDKTLQLFVSKLSAPNAKLLLERGAYAYLKAVIKKLDGPYNDKFIVELATNPITIRSGGGGVVTKLNQTEQGILSQWIVKQIMSGKLQPNQVKVETERLYNLILAEKKTGKFDTYNKLRAELGIAPYVPKEKKAEAEAEAK